MFNVLESLGVFPDLQHDRLNGDKIPVQSGSTRYLLGAVCESCVIQQKLCQCSSQDLHTTQEVTEGSHYIFVHQLYRCLPPASKVLH